MPNAQLMPARRRVGRRAGLGAVLGIPPGLANFGLTQPQPYTYVFNELDAVTGMPGAAASIATAIGTGDPGQIAMTVDTALVTALAGPLAGAAFAGAVGAVADLLTWLDGGSPPQSQYATNFQWPCDLPGCDPTGQNPCVAYLFDDVYPDTFWGGLGAMTPGT